MRCPKSTRCRLRRDPCRPRPAAVRPDGGTWKRIRHVWRCCPKAVWLRERSAHPHLSAARRRDQRARGGDRKALRRGVARAHRRVQEADRRRHRPRRPAGAGLRDRARGGQAHARPAPFRRPADRRHDPARGPHLRDEDRRRQDAGRDARGLSQRAHRPRRARRHRQRLPRPARRRMDGPDLQVPRPHRRRDRARARRRAAQAGLRLRHHLRHQQRARLRLSARQHEVPPGGHGPARPHLRDRRRGRLDPGRRGAHAADHLRPARRPLRVLQHHRHLHSQPRQDRLRGRREAAHRDADRSRHGEAGAAPARGGPAQGRIRSTTSRTSRPCTTSTRRCAPTSCSSATRTTSCATARSSSSTSSPAA